MAQPRFHSEDEKWMHEVEQMLQQHHTDVQRLWRRTPQGPVLGVPLTAPAVYVDVSGVGSGATSGIPPDHFLSGRSYGPYVTGSATGGPQFLRPDQDITVTGWTGTHSPLYAGIDEVTADDADYVQASQAAFQTKQATFGLTDGVDPGVNTGHIMRARMKREHADQDTILVVLYQGATVKATFTELSLTVGVFETKTYTLSSAQAGSITDYTDLRVLFSVNNVNASTRIFRVSWFELEIPSP